MTTRSRDGRGRRRAPASSEPSVSRSQILDNMSGLVEALGRALGPQFEVVLHDLERLPNSIVAIANPLTGRTVGDPPTDLLLRNVREGCFQDRYRYQARAAGGRMLRSSTLFIRDLNGMPIATLCLNEDITNLSRMRDLLDQQLRPAEAETTAMLAGEPDGAVVRGRPESQSSAESFAHGVPQLAELLIDQAIREVGIPVELMKKQHKLLVVRELERCGFFLIREAVEDAARALAVTRYTIYNYLNEIEAERNGGAEQDGADGDREPSD